MKYTQDMAVKRMVRRLGERRQKRWRNYLPCDKADIGTSLTKPVNTAIVILQGQGKLLTFRPGPMIWVALMSRMKYAYD